MDSKWAGYYPIFVLKTKKALFQRPIVIIRRGEAENKEIVLILKFQKQ